MPDPIYLRPEARPAHWPLLEVTQKEAFRHILKAIVQAATRLPQPAPRREARLDDPARWLSPNRASQILFLAGARGAGKTTVLTSLINASINASLEESRTASQPAPSPNTPMLPASGDLEVLRSRVIWLEPLDMEPAPPSLNLLPAILARIDAATYRLGVRGGAGEAEREREYRGLLDPSPELQDAFVQLQRFQASTALAWDSNLAARAGSLDPDSYAVEVMRAERARLSVNRTLEMVLDALAYSAFRGAAVWNPLFVLPIDDFDLNPSMSLALLQLLRMISVPRLFTLVLGDLSVAEVIVNLKLSSDLATVAETAARTNLLSMPHSMITAMGADLAANVLRKLIPPNQRIQLRHLDTLEALNFRPLGSSDADPLLHGLLGKCAVLFDGSPMHTALTIQGVVIDNLRDFLLVPKFSFSPRSVPSLAKPAAEKLEESELHRQDRAYSGIAMLHTTPRRMTDLWLALQQPADASGTPLVGERRIDTIDLFAQYCRLALTEERAFFPEQGQEAIAAIQKEPTGEWNLGLLPIRVTPRVDPWHSIQLGPPGEYGELPVYIHVRRARDWRFETTSVRASLSGTGPVLSEETAGALTLFHDLLALDPASRSFISPLIRSDTFFQPWVVLEMPGPVELPWPMPPFTSFWEFDLFLSVWNEAIQDFSRSSPLFPSSLARLVAMWIAAGTAILLGTSDIPPGWHLPREWSAWEKPMQDLVTLAMGHTPRARKAHDWLLSIAVLLMPESGIPAGDLNLVLLPLVGFWNQERERDLIRLRRYQRLSEVANGGMREVAERFRSATLPTGFVEAHRPQESFLQTSTSV